MAEGAAMWGGSRLPPTVGSVNPGIVAVVRGTGAAAVVEEIRGSVVVGGISIGALDVGFWS